MKTKDFLVGDGFTWRIQECDSDSARRFTTDIDKAQRYLYEDQANSALAKLREEYGEGARAMGVYSLTKEIVKVEKEKDSSVAETDKEG